VSKSSLFRVDCMCLQKPFKPQSHGQRSAVAEARCVLWYVHGERWMESQKARSTRECCMCRRVAASRCQHKPKRPLFPKCNIIPTHAYVIHLGGEPSPPQRVLAPRHHQLPGCPPCTASVQRTGRRPARTARTPGRCPPGPTQTAWPAQ